MSVLIEKNFEMAPKSLSLDPPQGIAVACNDVILWHYHFTIRSNRNRSSFYAIFGKTVYSSSLPSKLTSSILSSHYLLRRTSKVI